jgi:hypothetical protein
VNPGHGTFSWCENTRQLKTFPALTCAAADPCRRGARRRVRVRGRVPSPPPSCHRRRRAAAACAHLGTSTLAAGAHACATYWYSARTLLLRPAAPAPPAFVVSASPSPKGK